MNDAIWKTNRKHTHEGSKGLVTVPLCNFRCVTVFTGSVQELQEQSLGVEQGDTGGGRYLRLAGEVVSAAEGINNESCEVPIPSSSNRLWSHHVDASCIPVWRARYRRRNKYVGRMARSSCST